MTVNKLALGCAAVFAMLGAAVTVPAQTLADVARAEEARRKTVKEPGKVYTNQDLKRDSTGEAPRAPDVQLPGSQAAASPEAKAKDAAAATEPKTDEPARDEAYWRARMTQARDELGRSKTFLAALESRVNALKTDFVNRDDPGQRAVIERDRQTAVAEMERVQKDIERQTQAIADIEEEARRAGVPAGWLR